LAGAGAFGAFCTAAAFPGVYGSVSLSLLLPWREEYLFDAAASRAGSVVQELRARAVAVHGGGDCACGGAVSAVCVAVFSGYPCGMHATVWVKPGMEKVIVAAISRVAVSEFSRKKTRENALRWRW